jgi:integrase
MTETREMDALTEALSIIDRALGEMLHRELVSTNEVADLLGHRSINTTALYVKVAASQLADSRA